MKNQRDLLKKKKKRYTVDMMMSSNKSSFKMYQLEYKATEKIFWAKVIKQQVLKKKFHDERMCNYKINAKRQL